MLNKFGPVPEPFFTECAPFNVECDHPRMMLRYLVLREIYISPVEMRYYNRWGYTQTKTLFLGSLFEK